MTPATKRRVPAESTVRGQRVFLRSLRPADRRAWTDLRTASRDHLRPFDPRPPRGIDPYGNSGFGALKARSSDPASDVLLAFRREDGALLGGINLNQIVRGAFGSAYLGYWMGAEHAGQGYMTEALQLGLRRAFRQLRLHRVEANILPHNAPSLALVKRAGFTREGFSRRYLKIAGRWQDHERWALLAEDWKVLRTKGAGQGSRAR